MYGYYFLLTFLGNVLCAVCLSNVTIDKNSVNNDSNLWYGLIKDCKDSNQSCLKNSIYNFLKNTLDFQGDMQFTSFMKFSKNSNDYNKLFSNATNAEENDENFIKNETPMEEITRSLADNTKKFFITHDIEFDLPETFFLGSTLKISPRSFNDSSAMVKLEVVPKDLDESVGEGRIFIKKIRKFITERLIYALIAIILVIKLLAVKILFVLPAILGAAAAKKLIFKVLLFVFPFLHNFFKWCAYTPYGAKHHIHKHQISHIHEIAHGHHHHHKPHRHHHHGVEVIAPHSHGPPDHLPDYILHGGPPDHHHHHPEELYDEHEILHRKDSTQHEEGDEDDNEIDFWGQKKRRPTKIRKPTPTEIENMVLKAEKEALIKFRLQKERERIHEENLKLQEQLNNAIKLQQKLKQKSGIVTSKLPIKSSLVPPPPLMVAPLIPPPIPQPAVSEYSPQALFPQNYGHLNHISKPGMFAEPPIVTQQVVPTVQGSQPVASIQNVQAHTKNHHLVKVQSSIPTISQHVITVQNAVPTVSIQNAQSNVKVQNSAPPSKTAQLAIDYIKHQEILKQAMNHKPSELSQTKNVGLAPKSTPKPKPKQPSLEEQIRNAAAITYDSFYSPILDKIDKILSGLNFKDESCRKRLICSMYKNPEKFSPHSNLLSAELSRDPKELQKPTKTNAAVIRFYNYVQAARDGQDKRDCLRLYTSCAINTEDQKLF